MEKYRLKLEQYEGPLDLLLNMIEEQKMQITVISLSRVADQFIEYINQNINLRSEEMADFLVIATKLLYIKSKAILPGLAIEEEANDLERQLKIYKEYRDASLKIREMLKQERFMYARAKPMILFTSRFLPPKSLTAEKMRELFARALLRLEPIVNLPQAMIKKTISLRDKIRHISDLILSKLTLNFKQLLGGAKDKTEIIISFLAVLELVKQQTVNVDQECLFSEITVKKIIKYG